MREPTRAEPSSVHVQRLVVRGGAGGAERARAIAAGLARELPIQLAVVDGVRPAPRLETRLPAGADDALCARIGAAVAALVKGGLHA